MATSKLELALQEPKSEKAKGTPFRNLGGGPFASMSCRPLAAPHAPQEPGGEGDVHTRGVQGRVTPSFSSERDEVRLQGDTVSWGWAEGRPK